MNNILQLIIRNFIINKRRYLTVYLAIALTLMLVFFIQTFSIKEVSYEAMGNIFYFVFFLGGFIFTSNAFFELDSPAKSSFYLLIPASHLEKFIAQYLIVSVIYVIIAQISFLLVATIGASLACLSFDIYFSFYDYANIAHFEYIAIYLVLQTVFFTGSLYFKNNAFFKTLLSLVVAQIGMAFITGLFAWMVFGTTNFELEQTNFNGNILIFNKLEFIGKFLFWGVLGPFFLTVAYFKLTEKEV